MLIHDRDREPPAQEPPGGAAWEPNWRVWRWVLAAAIVVFAAASTTSGASTLLFLTGFGLCCRSVSEAVPYGDGLREWRQ